MKIRRPEMDVFQAFTDPDIANKFWFSRSSGKLENAARLTWYWDAAGISREITVEELIPYQHIALSFTEPAHQLDIYFLDLEQGCTQVRLKNYGFCELGDALHDTIIERSSLLTSVLAGLKSYLEHGIVLGLMEDRNARQPGTA